LLRYLSNLSAVLAYLHSCATSALLDQLRKQKLPVVTMEDALSVIPAELLGRANRDEFSRVERDWFWKEINKRLHSHKEYLVVYHSYVLDMTPLEIMAEFPNEFRSAKEIYDTKNNVLKRLRRDLLFHDRISSLEIE
jgi:DNA-directed RNA polymerase specialized sigma24 family protein